MDEDIQFYCTVIAGCSREWCFCLLFKNVCFSDRFPFERTTLHNVLQRKMLCPCRDFIHDGCSIQYQYHSMHSEHGILIMLKLCEYHNIRCIALHVKIYHTLWKRGNCYRFRHIGGVADNAREWRQIIWVNLRWSDNRAPTIAVGRDRLAHQIARAA